MRLVSIDVLVSRGPFAESHEWATVLADVQMAIAGNLWPPNNPRGTFEIFPESGKKRGMGNGVVPIKTGVLAALEGQGWHAERTGGPRNPGDFDAVKWMPGNAHYVGLEWETGNISSSHRAMNRMVRAHLEGHLKGGLLVLPTAALGVFLTDRIGTYGELMNYRAVWQDDPRWTDGVLAVIAVEHDATSLTVDRIPKGTDGRALG